MKTIHYTESINYEIELTARILKFAGTQMFDSLSIDIQTDEYCALDVISTHKNICQRDLAKYLLKDRANTGRILNSLEEKGLINRLADTRNNRLIRKINITEKGEKKLIEINAKLQEYITKTLQTFQENEIKKLHKAIKQFRENVEGLLKLKI